MVAGKREIAGAAHTVLDGRRVGELTALMSQRYGPTVDSMLRRGERPGCVARVVQGKRGVEVELRRTGRPTNRTSPFARAPAVHPTSHRPYRHWLL